ncbi:unnamed protein product, partial [Thlaspi arvense]
SESEKKILTEEELERKKKKDEKARAKELKKLKALTKQKPWEAKTAEDGTKRSTKKSSKREASQENPEDFLDPETPLGEIKRLSPQMAKQYSPSAVAKSWYAWWEKSDFFKADAKSSSSSKCDWSLAYRTCPNYCYSGFISTFLFSSIAPLLIDILLVKDTIIRWKRMSGYNALWVPGMDHAGIATQVAVEKNIMRERGLTRHDVGREEFINEVWKWKNQHGGTIQSQLRRLGASLDWSRECFTVDEIRSKAVTEAFVLLYKEGLIYRDIRLVNWDCVLQTAVSDVEVDYIDIKEITLLKVPGCEKPVEFGLGEVVVATTRVETMLGDTAIAVHPDDARYKHLHGKFAVHPFNGRKLPIICDAELIVPNFGTGCVKITPAHDHDDCKVGKRHNLEFINIFTDDGKINTSGGPEFTGVPRFAAREAVIETLKKQGLYRDAKDNEMRLGLCQRSGDVIEPMIKPQWYVNCSIMGKEALDVAAVSDGNKKLEFIPKQYTAEWRRWLENIRDWCISRQLWWGHRIPAWYATLEEDELKEVGSYNDHWVVARTEEEARREASRKFSGKKFELRQDDDVLDTWFSSGLLPLSGLGWPDETDDFKAFYPTSVLETGHDILFFWVARMVMMGMKLSVKNKVVITLTHSLVYFHPIIRDAQGRKMSKSLGNGIDPLEVVNGVTLEGLHKRLDASNLDPKEVAFAKQGQVKDFPNGIPECGSDALRFALVSYTAQSDKIILDIHRLVGYRQWCNKLWNAVRFAMMRLGDDYSPPVTLSPEAMPFSCQWILSVLNKAVSKTVESLNAFEFADAANTVYAWWQYQFCDVYIEVIKPYFAGDKTTFASERAHAQDALWVSLETGLRLLHPFMPFSYGNVCLHPKLLKERSLSCYATTHISAMENWTNDKVESEMETVLAMVKSVRAHRAEKMKNERLPASALCENMLTYEIAKSHELEIRTLTNLSSLEVLLKGEH